jgi:phosphoglycolate phosphatase-like HAD superfamily hydrolase
MDLVDVCVSGDAAERSKPDPDIIVAALRAGGVDSAEAMLIGDTPYDVEAAARAGVPCIGVRCEGWTDEGLLVRLPSTNPADLLLQLDESPIGARLGLATRARRSRGAAP